MEMNAGNDTNRELLRAALSTPGTQTELALRTGLKDRTVSNLMRGLADRNEVHVAVEAKGRRPRVWALGPSPEFDDGDDDGDAAEAQDLAASRAWLGNWQPRRCPLVAVLFGQPGPTPDNDSENQRHRAYAAGEQLSNV